MSIQENIAKVEKLLRIMEREWKDG